MRIIAIDIATVTGWAFADGAGLPVYGSQRMGRRGGSLGECYMAFRDWLAERLDGFQPNVLVFETPILGRGAAEVAQRLMGLAAHADEMGTRRGLKVYRVENSTAMKAFTGRGGRFPDRKQKKMLVVETCRRYGWDPQDDNAGDALMILHYAQSILGRGSVERAAGPLFAGRI